MVSQPPPEGKYVDLISICHRFARLRRSAARADVLNACPLLVIRLGVPTNCPREQPRAEAMGDRNETSNENRNLVEQQLQIMDPRLHALPVSREQA